MVDRQSAVMLESFSDKAFAEAAADLLAAEGIDVFIVADDAGGLLPNLDFARGVRVLVAPEDVERAEAILAPVDEPDGSAPD